MALAITVVAVDASQQGIVVVTGNIAASGNYAAGGDTLDFTAVNADAKFSGLQASIPSSKPPLSLAAWSANGNLLRDYSPVIGTAMNNSKLKAGATVFGTELAAGAYPIDVTGDVINFEAVFTRFQ